MDLLTMHPYKDGMQSVYVSLTRQDDYASPGLRNACSKLLEAAEANITFGAKVLVKPNLVSASKGPLACSEPALVAALCGLLLDSGAKVVVADSPAFGSGAGVAEKCGLAEALRPLGLQVGSLGNPVPLGLSSGGRIGISQDALETDLILNVPRLKAHCQLYVTASVKNLFGCVAGIRKALAHSRFGEKGDTFESMILDVMQALPPTLTILDAVRAMHKSGPINGEPYHLGMLGAARQPVAMDTAVYTILGLQPAEVPLWQAAQKRKLLGSSPEHLHFPMLGPEDFKAEGFLLPEKLDPVSFNPYRIARGAVRRACALLR
jgi:uncharacterized protein (DUF362 family)